MRTREEIVHSLLGQPVHVVVDRPVGYRHGDIVYPINYGYIPGVIAGDGEEQDVYILGVSEPLTAFDGRVIGAIRRKDDCEDKLVAAPEGMLFHQAQIAEAVQFQEQYFTGTVDALLRKSCGVIPYRKTAGETEFLILLQTNRCWSFPKGHMEPGEAETETALRELLEETGLTARLRADLAVVSEYDIPPLSRKMVVLFPGEVQGTVIPQPQEVLDHRWVPARELARYLHSDTWLTCAELVTKL